MWSKIQEIVVTDWKLCWKRHIEQLCFPLEKVEKRIKIYYIWITGSRRNKTYEEGQRIKRRIIIHYIQSRKKLILIFLVLQIVVKGDQKQLRQLIFYIHSTRKT